MVIGASRVDASSLEILSGANWPRNEVSSLDLMVRGVVGGGFVKVVKGGIIFFKFRGYVIIVGEDCPVGECN